MSSILQLKNVKGTWDLGVLSVYACFFDIKAYLHTSISGPPRGFYTCLLNDPQSAFNDCASYAAFRLFLTSLMFICR